MSCQDCCSVNFSLWRTRWRISTSNRHLSIVRVRAQLERQLRLASKGVFRHALLFAFLRALSFIRRLRVRITSRKKPQNSALKPKAQRVSGPLVFPNRAYDIADQQTIPTSRDADQFPKFVGLAAGASPIRTLGPSLWSRRRLVSRPCQREAVSHPIEACTLAFGGEAQEFLLHGLDLGEICRDVVIAAALAGY